MFRDGCGNLHKGALKNNSKGVWEGMGGGKRLHSRKYLNCKENRENIIIYKEQIKRMSECNHVVFSCFYL